jgi:positive phototaxis protein PixI
MSQIMNQLSPPQLVRQISSAQAESNSSGQRFLGFTIGDSLNALIPLDDLQATIKVSLAEILPVPRMKDSLLGIINYRGKATWVVDLAHLMGGGHYANRSPEVDTGMGLLFEVQNETVALLIQRVSTIETYDLQQCLPIGDGMFTDRMRSFLSGYFMDTNQQPWVVLDLARTIQSII